MTRRFLVHIATIFVAQTTIAQIDFTISNDPDKPEVPKFPVYIPAEEVEPVSKADFEVDAPGEAAIYLINEGNTEIRFDYNAAILIATTKKLFRIKVLNAAGYDLGNFKIPLYVTGKSAGKEERIRDIKATTYNLDVESSQIDVSLLDREQIHRTELRENVEQVSFALPNVKVNSIIQVSYVVESPFLTRIDDWYFQKEHPVKQCAYSFRVIAPFRYAFALQGQEQFANGKTNDDRGMASLGRLRPYFLEWWSAEDIPAYKKEPHTSIKEDHIAKLSIQLETTPSRSFLKSWQDVSKDLQESKRFNQFYTGKKDFQSLGIPEGIPSLAKAQYVYEDFKSQFKWDGKYSVYPNVSFRELVGKKEGNTSSLGLALYQILKQSGYDVNAILLSPRYNGKINYSYPFIDRLVATAVRLKIDGKTYLLDPVNEVPFGYLHESFLNGKGLVLDKDATWQDLTLGLKDYKTSQVSIEVSEDLITADLQLTMKDYGVIEAEDPKDLFKSDWEVSEVNVDKNELTLQQLTAKIEQEADDDLILIPLSLDRIIFSENPFNSNERQYPVDFLYNKQYSYKLEIKLSDQFVFDAIPEGKIVKTSDGKLSALLNVNQIGQKLNLTFLFWTKTSSFDVAYYPHLQSAYQLMAELAEGSIIVKRKS